MGLCQMTMFLGRFAVNERKQLGEGESMQDLWTAVVTHTGSSRPHHDRNYTGSRKRFRRVMFAMNEGTFAPPTNVFDHSRLSLQANSICLMNKDTGQILRRR